MGKALILLVAITLAFAIQISPEPGHVHPPQEAASVAVHSHSLEEATAAGPVQRHCHPGLDCQFVATLVHVLPMGAPVVMRAQFFPSLAPQPRPVVVPVDPPPPRFRS